MVAATFVFALLFLVYGVVPHQWLTRGPTTSSTGGRTTILAGPATAPTERCGSDLPDHDHVTQTRPRHHRRRHLRRVPRPRRSALWVAAGRSVGKPRADRDRPTSTLRPTAGEGGRLASMAKTDANPPHARVPRRLRARRGRRRLPRQGGQAQAVHPHRPVRVHHVRGLRRHLPVEVHPHARHRTRSPRPINTEQPGDRPRRPRRLHHRRGRVHPLRPLRRPVPDRRDHPRQDRRRAPATATRTSATTTTATPTACGSRRQESIVAKTIDDKPAGAKHGRARGRS